MVERIMLQYGLDRIGYSWIGLLRSLDGKRGEFVGVLN